MFGVAILAAVFAANGSFVSPAEQVDGLVPAMGVGAVVVAVGALAALALPGRTRSTDVDRDIDPGRAESPVGFGEAPLAMG
ncbi:MAG: hypothetical protein ACSLFN_01500 [Candidatus Limnocylindrales bacterium]